MSTTPPLLIDPLRFKIALSAIAAGLDRISRGKAHDGHRLAHEGLVFLRGLAEPMNGDRDAA